MNLKDFLLGESKPIPETFSCTKVIEIVSSFLFRNENTLLIEESLYVVALICEHQGLINIFVNCDGLQALNRHIFGLNSRFVESAIQVLLNISSNGRDMCAILLENGLFARLIHYISRTNITLVGARKVFWILTFITKYVTAEIEVDAIILLLNLLSRVNELDDAEIILSSLWSLYNITYRNTENSLLMVNRGLLPRLIVFLRSGHAHILMPVLRINCNVIPTSDDCKVILLNQGLLEIINRMLRHENHNIVKLCLTIVSFIGNTGSTVVIERICNVSLMRTVVDLLYDDNYLVAKEATQVLASLTFVYGARQLGQLVRLNIIRGLSEKLIFYDDANLLIAVLDSFHNILSAELQVADAEKVRLDINTFGGIMGMRRLLHHNSSDVYLAVRALLMNYF